MILLLSELGSVATTCQSLASANAGETELFGKTASTFFASNSRGMSWDNWELRCENLFLGSESKLL